MNKEVMKNKGYTLIELIAVMAIIAILLTSYGIGIKWYKSCLNRIDTSYTQDSILIFITNSKHYCREKGSRGYISFDIVDNEMIFFCDGKCRDKFQLPSELSLYGTNLMDNKIHIDNTGFTSDACTIKFKDREGKLHNITLCVGTAYVEIKD